MKISETRIDEPFFIDSRKWIAIFVTYVVTGALTVWSIYGIGEYGIALFILIPLLVGLLSTTILGYKREITRKQAILIGFQSLAFIVLSLIIFALEGVVCIFMAAPFALLLTWIGSVIGHQIINKNPNHSVFTALVLFLLIPFTAFKEKDRPQIIKPVITKVIINSNKQTVWKNVIAFPKLKEPTETIFKVGISFPIESRIEGNGVGATRYCKFNTGEFVEPITEWKENELLKFKVIEQPIPLREISFWDVNSPHLHDYFVSTEGQFKLTDLENGKLELEGTTWYYHDIKPDFYWRMWSNYIIHKIHKRVLDHIKEISENQ
ncbi:MAG: hypothetical protein IPM42_15615 [Saprospiraceae bacterium]|nr:hypothetical protein [Saprospiraceae bacterium]